MAASIARPSSRRKNAELRPSPADHDAERSVLGAVLIDPLVLQRFADRAKPDVFELARHRIVYCEFLAMLEDGVDITLLTLTARLRERGMLEKVGGIAFLAELADSVVTAAHVNAHLDILIRLARARRLLKRTEDASRRLLEGEDIDTLEAEMRKALDETCYHAGPATPLLLSADEFEGDEMPETLVESLIHVAVLILLTGRSKAGKSYWAHQLCAAVATGSDFLGFRTRRAPVLIVCLEMTAALIRERLESICRDTGIRMPVIGEELFLACPTRERMLSLSLLDKGDRARLGAAIRESGAKLVLIDTLNRFILGTDPNDNGQMGTVFAGLAEFAHESGAALLIMDHTAKGENTYSASQSALGAQAKGAACSTIVSLKRTDRENGGRFEMDVESHFGSWDEPVPYGRPQRSDGTHGAGCVRLGAAEAKGLTFEKVAKLFEDFGQPNVDGHPTFRSLRSLREAVIEAKFCGKDNRSAEALIKRIEKEFSGEPDSPLRVDGVGRKVYTWIGARP